MRMTYGQLHALAEACVRGNDKARDALLKADVGTAGLAIALVLQSDTEALGALVEAVDELRARLDFHDELEAYGREDG